MSKFCVRTHIVLAFGGLFILLNYRIISTYLIEMGYDLYTMAHNGKTTQVLRQELSADAAWIKVGSRTEALDMSRQQFGECPYPLRLTLLRWACDDTFNYSTLISFSETDPLPLADLFPTYHQRQDVEAGIKQGKGTFSFTKLRVRSPAGIALLGQFALFFCRGQRHSEQFRYLCLQQDLRQNWRIFCF